ncbi:hypothetical protein LUZ63_016108 [Rhynchospora breviuscula]|uniref:Uncharacterized protein n=1 Tax=Rhynchospora breviuscula TaxID=2022672 RepID=A0A9Q0CDL8_9POAL|nr:hypothetical protein LUZ63_016108 [Rhynchospora breviuscula]
MEVLSNPFSSVSQVPLLRIPKSHQATGFLLPPGKQRLVPRLRIGMHATCRAQTLNMALSLVADSSPRDISVLLPVSALLIFVYWIANFVVPKFIMEDLQKDETPDNKGSS